jgi:hypothetical protein
VTDGDVELAGDAGAWRAVPRAHVAYHPETAEPACPYVLLLIGSEGASAEVQRLRWFCAAEGYDLDWQGLLEAVELPDRPLILIPIQRSSSPVVYDPEAHEVVGHVSLAGRGGNPTLRFRGDELWADDYDTLLRLSARDLAVRDRRRLQGSAGATMQFIGGWAFTRDGSLCAVARPYSADVVALDTRTFRVTHRAECGRQPLDVAVLDDGRVFARDWQTGDLIEGRLRRAGGRRL